MTFALTAHSRLLVVAPHPDDETLATGQLVQQVLAAGGSVHLLLLTDGDDNPWPQRWLERRLRITVADRRRWAERRRAELLRAMACLGSPADALTALGWADQGLTRRVQRQCAPSIARLREVLAAFAPTLVAMPALHDSHPDHAAAHVLMRLALAGLQTPPACLLYSVHGAVVAGRPIDWPADPRMATRKAAALECHVSQLALSGGRLRRLATRPERFVLLEESAAAQTVCLPWHPPAAVQPWLAVTVVRGDDVQVLRWRDVPWHRNAAGDYGLSPSPRDDGAPAFVRLQCTLPSPWIFDHWGWCELAC